jgi:putative glutamine transport system permease protein
MEFLQAYSATNLLFLLSGLKMTLYLSVIVVIMSLFMGSLIASLQYRHIPVLFELLMVGVDAIRNLPPLLIIFFAYFALPNIGINFSPLSAASIGLGLYGAALMSEVIRGGLLSIEKTQMETAWTQGFTWFQTFRLILFPQAFLRVIPPLVGIAVTLIKNTSYAYVVGIEELTRVGNILYSGNVQLVFPIISLIAVLYFILNYSVSFVGRYFEKAGNQ